MPAAAGHRVDPAGRPRGAGHQGVHQRRLADARVADEHADPVRQLVAQLGPAVAPRLDDDVRRGPARRRSPAASRVRRGRTWSGTAAGRSPASYAATRQRSISRGRGSGSASAVTIGQLVGVGDDHPLERVGVVGGTPQHRGARLDPHDAGEGVLRARQVADQGDPVADHDAPCGPARGPSSRRPRGRPTRQVQPAAVDGDDHARGRRPRAWGGPWCGVATPGGPGGPGRRPRPARGDGAGGGPPVTRASRSTARRSRAGSWPSWRCSVDSHARARRARGPPPRGHPVVVVRVEDAAVQRARPDLQPVVGLA